MKKKSLAKEVQYRRSVIAEADRLFGDCEQLTVRPPQESEQSARYWRRAAKLYGMAADRYRQAGLGLRAIVALKAAAQCFDALDLPDEAQKHETRANAIQRYWHDE